MKAIIQSYQPYFILVFFLLGVAVVLPHIWLPTEPITVLSTAIQADNVPKWLLVVVMGILNGLGSWWFNRLFNKKEFQLHSTTLPGLIYALWMGAISFIYFDITAPLLGISLIAGLSSQIEIFRQPRVFSHAFASAFWFGLASIILFPGALFVASIFSALAIARTFNWREYLLVLLGLASPWIWFISLTYLFDSSPINSAIPAYETPVSVNAMQWTSMIGLTLLSLYGVTKFVYSLSSSTNKARNTKNSALIFVAISILTFWVVHFTSPGAALCLSVIPLALLAPSTIMSTRSGLIQNLLFYLLLALLALPFIGAFLHQM